MHHKQRNNSAAPYLFGFTRIELRSYQMHTRKDHAHDLRTSSCTRLSRPGSTQDNTRASRSFDGLPAGLRPTCGADSLNSRISPSRGIIHTQPVMVWFIPRPGASFETFRARGQFNFFPFQHSLTGPSSFLSSPRAFGT